MGPYVEGGLQCCHNGLKDSALGAHTMGTIGSTLNRKGCPVYTSWLTPVK